MTGYVFSRLNWRLCLIGLIALVLSLSFNFSSRRNCSAFSSSQAWAEQTITVDKDVSHHVFGNGDIDDNGKVTDLTKLRNPNNNTVNVHNGVVVEGDDLLDIEIPIGVVGGAALVDSGNVEARGNSATIAGDVDGYVYGGVALIGNGSGNASVANNTVTINNGGRVNGKIYGGAALINDGSGNATAINNTLIIKDGAVYGYAYGAEAMIRGGSGNAIAANNTLTINDGEFDNGYFVGGHAHTDAGSATVTGNSMSVTNSNFYDITPNFYSSVFGGEAESREGSATATGNSMSISNSNFAGKAYVFGGYAEIVNGVATATGNTVRISGDSNFGGTTNIYGGYAGLHPAFEDFYFDEESDGYYNLTLSSSTATASGNTVSISGGNFADETNVYGGFIYAHEQTTTVKATNNTVTISGTPALSNVNIYGGDVEYYNGSPSNQSKDVFSGNTLNVWNDKGSGFEVASVQNFQSLNFVFPADQSDAVLTGAATLGDTTFGNSTVTASTFGGTAPLRPGAVVTLIDGTITDNGFNTQATGKHGATLRYKLALENNDDSLVATVENVEANPEAKALSEGFLGSFTVVTEGGNLVAGQGMSKAVQAGAGGSLGGFGAVSAGSMRHKSGSHVDVDGFSLMTGLSKGLETDPGKLTVGAFVEFGYGSYETYNSFAGNNLRNEGKTQTIGGGVLGRLEMNSGLYTEASLRAGYVRNEFKGGDLRGAMGGNAGYNTNTLYSGLHLGGGYVLDLSEANSLDLYGKYFWTRQGGDSVTTGTNDPVEFKAVNSHRLRGGARFTHTLDEAISPYVGAAYEYEFDGKSKASTYGYDIDAPSISGSTGMAELGVNIKPVADSAFSLDLGLQGYTGKREGLTGSVQFKFEF